MNRCLHRRVVYTEYTRCYEVILDRLSHASADFYSWLFFFNLFTLFYLVLAALGLCCCARAFSSCGEWGLLFVAVHELLIVVSSLVAEHRLQARKLQ